MCARRLDNRELLVPNVTIYMLRLSLTLFELHMALWLAGLMQLVMLYFCTHRVSMTAGCEQQPLMRNIAWRWHRRRWLTSSVLDTDEVHAGPSFLSSCLFLATLIFCGCIGNRSHTPDDSERATLSTNLAASRHAYTTACQAAAGDDRIVQAEAKLQEAEQHHAAVGIASYKACTCQDHAG
jgi:hypothetical protein